MCIVHRNVSCVCVCVLCVCVCVCIGSEAVSLVYPEMLHFQFNDQSGQSSSGHISCIARRLGEVVFHKIIFWV